MNSARIPSSLLRWCSTPQCLSSPLTSVARYRLNHSGAAQSRSDNQFPYPKHRNPTPHQIFHLPHNATPAQIKARYYDLVRLYHPDKAGLAAAGSTSTADEAHARFQAITAAYDSLRGKTPLKEGSGDSTSSTIDRRYQTTAAYRTMQRKRQELYNTGAIDDSHLDKILIAGVVGTVLFVIFHTLTMRREAMAEAVARTRALPTESNGRRRQEVNDLQKLSMDAVERVNKPR
ncbi:hypothetical protein CPB83DRAFT_790312 [Crepidotus variabilis]|uniref:J domain-containing protein n=1 Tax=Crepidotus variabilis TaxID=179855 RepID=A0A9P6JR02_9AGAR|nr:hypothetical protein CPB83DRAFT_790312 [Crepidotus variabilis]